MANITRLTLRAIGININYAKLGCYAGASTGRFYPTRSHGFSKQTQSLSLFCRSSPLLMKINQYCTQNTLSDSEIKRAVDNISEKFTEAMELMNDARSSVGTVYFSEDMDDTTAQVQDTLQDYQSLVSQLTDKQKKHVIQSIGLKMEELKAQMSLLHDLAKD